MTTERKVAVITGASRGIGEAQPTRVLTRRRQE